MKKKFPPLSATIVKVSPKYQVVIPKQVRELINLPVGSRVEIFPYDGRIEIIPVGDIRELKGMAKGMDTTIKREPDRV